MKKVLLVVLSLAAALADYTSYDGYTVYSAIPKTNDDAELLLEMEQAGHYDFWSEVTRLSYPVSIMVPPHYKKIFTSTLDNNKIEYSVLIDNVESVVSEERMRQERTAKAGEGRIDFYSYYRYDDILEYLNTLAENYADITSVEVYGRSYEGRALTLIRVGTDIDDNTKPKILIEGGIHAREWIAPAVTLYIIQQLVENDANRAMIEDVNWIIVPVTNPDGYEYSHTNARMWRKTRSIGIICNGVDGNRNFDYGWGGAGTSTSQCGETFPGPNAFSEPEASAFAEVTLAAENIALYISVHSYGNYLLYPWGYTTEAADNTEELQALGDLVAQSIYAVNQTEYRVGSTAGILYLASGVSPDWCKGVAGIPLSYTIELPGGGNQGFDIPANRILPVALETFPGIETFYKYVTGQISIE